MYVVSGFSRTSPSSSVVSGFSRTLLSSALAFALAATIGVAAQDGPNAAAPRAGAAASDAAVVPGELVIDPPTLINLGFEWFVQGDANRNASVEVSFRKKGESGWKPALPMLRLQGERIYAESRVDV